MGIIEVDADGFWYGGKFWSKDTKGNLVVFTKKECEQMIINGKVLVIED